jgi:glycosidase
MGMYVILDIIFNHTGDVFAYTEDRNPDWRPEAYPVEGFRDAAGRPNLPFSPIDRLHFPDAFPHGAVWPKELQQPECFTRRGKIRNWDDCPEFEEGDFFALKDLHLGQWDENTFHPSAALITLTTVYKYWLAFADLDGFRIDTVKHMPPAAVAYFAQEIRQFAASLGKHRFLLIGEIVGDRTNACRRLIDSELDAALGIGEVPQKIKQIVTGQEAPQSYFDIFANSRREGEAHPDPVWWRNRVVTFFDDHDQVGSEKKERFAALFGDRCEAEYAVLRAATFQVLTLGIPCLYYGTEQGFAGQAPPDLPQVPDEPSKDDCFLRECLFGGAFGAFESKGRHFFQESGWLYQQIAQLLTLRRHHAVLRRGRQYLRPLSLDGESFWLPGPGEEAYWGVIAWSRLLDVHEMVCAINTDPTESHSVFAAVDDSRNGSSGSPLICHYSTDESQRRETMRPEYTAHGYALPLTVPPGGVVVYGG